MCNLYSVTRGQQAIRALAKAMRDNAGNLPLLNNVFPDTAAPIVRIASDGERELAKARWGMPSPTFALAGKTVDRGVTNIRNTASPHWRCWLGPSNRCLVPFTAFTETTRGANDKSVAVWFALDEAERLGFFAGIWTGWTSTRKRAEGEITCDLYGFLTTAPNAEVGRIHPKAMPMILTEESEWDTWLFAPWAEAVRLQRPLPDGTLIEITRAEIPSAERELCF
jgi:putative SOS response-associated peptidase YedK